MANMLLGTYTILFSLELLYNCLKWSGYLLRPEFAHFSFLHCPLWLTYGPLIYIYVRRVVAKVGFQQNDLWFLVPILAIAVLILPFYKLPASKKVEIMAQGSFYDYVNLPYEGIWVVIGLMLFYAWLTFRHFGPMKMSGFRENKWLKWLLGSYLGFVLAFFFYVFVVRFNIMDYRYDYFVDIVIVVFIGMLAFFGFVQPEIFEGKTIREVVPFIKYRKTGMSDALSHAMKDKLMQLMRDEKPYLENTLRLDDLAEKLNLSRNHTSQIINQHFNLSFFDFINKYRVYEAKRLLTELEEEKTTVTQIAYDAGFNNRASFYKAFKKFESQSPTQYLNPQHAS